MLLKITDRFPWWSSGSESTCQGREHWFDPLSGKIPHAGEQLSPWACALEPGSPNYWAMPRDLARQQEKPLQWEAQAQLQSSPLSPQLEKAHAQ